jgi:uncharacterized lipoprotein YehR (DUF1307 family)
MKGTLENLYQGILFCLMSTMLIACQGSNDEQSIKYSINANTTNIAFSNEFLQENIDSFRIDVTFRGDGLLVGFAPDSEVLLG